MMATTQQPFKWTHWISAKVGQSTIYQIDKRYTIISKIGQGTYGTVALAMDNKENRKKRKKEVAIKKIGQLFGCKTDSIRILREIQILKHLNGNRFTHLVGVILFRKVTQNSHHQTYLHSGRSHGP
mmetsp:Transcript_17939/g.43907  ORF Transcript_17939/g.43907 Transcript_17939/m.43907 type:complete len:126 (+) Transcript_17939:22-399(+)